MHVERASSSKMTVRVNTFLMVLTLAWFLLVTGLVWVKDKCNAVFDATTKHDNVKQEKHV